jgi:predicted transcriptional regulator
MKTAVQELVDELLFVESIKENEITKSNKAILITAAIKQAFEKEKEQIIQAHIDGFDHIVVDFKKQEYAEQYYNQTYNQNQS